MGDNEASELSPDEQRIAGALEVVRDGEQRLVKLGDTSVPMPTLQADAESMDRFNRFLAQTQLGSIERKKQRSLRRLTAEAEVEILRARTEAIIAAHKGLAAEALAEIVIAANQYGRQAMRKDDLSEQENVQRAILQAALQYSTFIQDVPDDLADGIRASVLDNALQVYEKTIERINSADFSVNVDSPGQ
ncbi:MAG: hypothetical protein GY851_11195 [bacterium]|nr:hypothetical protein [bacterium]